ncbi:MAG: hypothetical protein MUD12_14665 [Spirochaetes bacterium]|nr:hypothetical protein [Spirochaetota bacterium]
MGNDKSNEYTIESKKLLKDEARAAIDKATSDAEKIRVEIENGKRLNMISYTDSGYKGKSL